MHSVYCSDSQQTGQGYDAYDLVRYNVIAFGPLALTVILSI